MTKTAKQHEQDVLSTEVRANSAQKAPNGQFNTVVKQDLKYTCSKRPQKAVVKNRKW